MKGKISKYKVENGYGFIRDANGADRFFHISNIKSVDEPTVGADVEFTPSVDRTKEEGKNLIAIDVYVQPKLTEICNICGKPMVERKGPHGMFLGCSAYPNCKSTKSISVIEKPQNMRVVVLVSCAEKQREGRWKASLLYDSDSFRESLDCANAISNDVFIISSAHGLVRLDTEIENYNVVQSDKSQEELDAWGKKVAMQLTENDIDIENTEFVILAWRFYYKPLLKHIQYYELPLYKVSPSDKSAKLKELLKEKGI